MIELESKYFKDIETAEVVEVENFEDYGIFEYERYFDIEINGIQLGFKCGKCEATHKLKEIMEQLKWVGTENQAATG